MKHLTMIIYAWLLLEIRKILLLFEFTMPLIFLPRLNRIRIFNGNAKMYLAFIKAKKNVPAYRDFLKEQNFKRPTFYGWIPNFEEIPPIDKENYIKQYEIEKRCIKGKIPNKGVIFDESSGSSGTATNWVRGKKERNNNAKFLKFGIKKLFGNEPLFIINAFALGPWATGVNITMGCTNFSKIKSLGPDNIKIENTLKNFGNQHKYLIMGYPPFLKLLVENSTINWLNYNVSFIFGGESMSEELRDFLLQKGIRKIYSSLGASDLELNIASETDFTISIRRLLRTNIEFRDKIVKYNGALPMVLQYNPSDFAIESSKTDELIITICRSDYLAPKIRYNIHDKGYVLSVKEIYNVMKELNINHDEIIKPKVELPVLFHFGRSDMTVSFFGATISPTDIQETLDRLPKFIEFWNSFFIKCDEINGTKQLLIGIEMKVGKSIHSLDLKQARIDFFNQLALTNQDFKEARKMITNENQMKIEFFENGKDFFKDNDSRIKAKYIQ